MNKRQQLMHTARDLSGSRATPSETIMLKRIEISTAVMLVGLVIGATSPSWWFAIGSIAAVYSSLLVGHLVVAVGLLLNPSRRRTAIALLLAVLMWWPVVLGDHIWA